MSVIKCNKPRELKFRYELKVFTQSNSDPKPFITKVVGWNKRVPSTLKKKYKFIL